MEVRITTRIEIYIEGDSLDEIRSKYESMDLFSKEAKECSAGVVETVSAERVDDGSYREISLEGNIERDDDEDMSNCLIKVMSVEQIQHLIEEKNIHDFFVLLNGGLRSSKTIDYDEGYFNVVNEIDGTEQNLSYKDMENEELTNIGKAIKCGAFFAYNC